MVMSRNNNDKKSSIIIPSYNAQDTIAAVFDTIIIQSIMPDEVLVGVDSCSNTLEVIKKLSETHPIRGLLKVFWFTKKPGCHIIRNTLALLSNSDIIVFFDADDEMLSNYVESMIRPICENGNLLVQARRTKNKKPSGGQLAILRDKFIRFGGLEPWICAADTEFRQRLQQEGMELVTVPKPNMHYYRRSYGLIKTTKRLGLREQFREEIRKRKRDPVFRKELSVSPFRRVF